jgi:prevent-host-death family protein
MQPDGSIEIVTAKRLRLGRGEILRKVRYDNATFVITSHGSPVAVLSRLPITTDKEGKASYSLE